MGKQEKVFPKFSMSLSVWLQKFHFFLLRELPHIFQLVFVFLATCRQMWFLTLVGRGVMWLDEGTFSQPSTSWLPFLLGRINCWFCNFFFIKQKKATGNRWVLESHGSSIRHHCPPTHRHLRQQRLSMILALTVVTVKDKGNRDSTMEVGGWDYNGRGETTISWIF